MAKYGSANHHKKISLALRHFNRTKKVKSMVSGHRSTIKKTVARFLKRYR